MTIRKNIGENEGIDADKEIEDVSYEPQESETEILEEKSDAQRLKDGDVILDINKTSEVEVSPHSIYEPPEKEEGDEEEEVEEEEEKEEGEEVKEEKEVKKEEDEEEQEDEEEPEKKEKKPAAAPDAVQKRINKITREKYDAQRETDKLKKELAVAKKKLKETEFEKKTSDLAKERPKEDGFDTDEEYHIALGRWAAKTEIHESSAPLEEEVVEEEPENVVQKIIDVGKETYPDFEELVLREDLKITPLMVEAAADSEHATEIFYHLGQHPELAEKIASMRSPAQVAREIGRIEFGFIQDEVEEVVTHEPTQDTEEVEEGEKKPKKKKKTPVAPPPVKPLGGGGKTTKSLEDASIADYFDMRGYTRDGMEKRRVS